MTVSEYENHDVQTSSGTQTAEQDWLSERQKVIGASEWAAILGHGYSGQTIHSVWTSKVYPESVRPLTGDFLEVGKILEPALARVAERFLNSNLAVQHTRKPRVIRHGDRSSGKRRRVRNGMESLSRRKYLGASLDAVIFEKRKPTDIEERRSWWPGVADEFSDLSWCPLELKSVSGFARSEWDNGSAPLKHEIQLQAQMFVTQCPIGCLFTIIDNAPVYRWRRINKGFIDAVLPRLEYFWMCVRTKSPPEIREEDYASESVAKMLKAVYPEDDGRHIELPPEAADWHAAREHGISMRKDAAEIIDSNTNKIREAIGSATSAAINDVTYTLKRDKRGIRTLRTRKAARNDQ